MITSSAIYWVTRADHICNVLSLLTGVFCVISIHSLLAFVSTIGDSNEEDKYVHKRLVKYLYILIPLLSLLAFLRAMTPSTKELAAIIVLPKVVNSEFVQKDLPAETKELSFLAKEYLMEKVKDTNNQYKGK